ncbi:nucleoside-binding protein [Paracoccus halophilus]|uniref:Membrane protein n=1 Tax=Paracoccus halophilus TaxID=376733 RepID=A0A099F7M2_9RHOB|nr:BMP family ABC transporter substrate-binding protein [Paracoccus halophilus]KGJ06695.1 membrane protein [Paracoccus halophilus]SFA42132.1 nucleoside-binding protein [Paracoccus halophilus]
MSLMKPLLTGTLLSLLPVSVLADPALIFDIGGKFDKSFNESAYRGAERWKAETGGSYKELDIRSEAQREDALRQLAQISANPIVMTGFAFGEVLNKIAPDYPQTKFVIIDTTVDQPNVQSVTFAEQEGSYLAGVLAARASKSGTVGFIGGMDVPLIHKFECGYAQGVKATDPEAEVLINYTGTTAAAWNDPVKGGELVRAQISKGADVVYAAAGATGIGVLDTAAKEGILSIGVDSNQNHLHPGQVLTSVVKAVDESVYLAFKAGVEVEPGMKLMDLASGGVSLAMDENNRDLITEEMTAAVEAATQAIVSGAIQVHDYSTDDTCPVE